MDAGAGIQEGQQAFMSGQATHIHVEEAHTGIWLERRIGQASTIDWHTYCLECGLVRQHENKGRPSSFFIQGVANLVEDMLICRVGKITQAEARLMVKAIRECPDLNDTYSTNIDQQISRFLQIARSFRPNLTDEMIFRSLFRKSKRTRV